MNNLSDIGFDVNTEEEFFQLLETAYTMGNSYKTKAGTYHRYTDRSGAELWVQVSNDNELLGGNPHYDGKSRRRVCLTEAVLREGMPMDGGFHCWAEPANKKDPESGLYPFVFDLPDFRTITGLQFPCDCTIQLTAFAHDISLYDSEADYEAKVTDEHKMATQSFIPVGLFSDEENAASPQQAFGMFTGIVRDVKIKRNVLGKQDFYWLLVDTYGGEVDVVADMRLAEKEPVKTGIIQGQFWLSGRVIEMEKEGAGFFKKLLGKN